jgi:hypothetical protein
MLNLTFFSLDESSVCVHCAAPEKDNCLKMQISFEFES